MVNNATGQFVSDAGMNLGQFTSGTDYAATMANNLRMVTPYGFKKGGKIEKAQEIFDELYIIFTDYSLAETKKVAKESLDASETEFGFKLLLLFNAPEFKFL